MNQTTIYQKRKLSGGLNIQKIIFAIICLEVFLVPIFFLPFTSNVLDLNKEFLFLMLTAVAVVLWFGQGLKNRQFKLTYIPLFLLAPAFLFFYTIASLFSKARGLSFLGIAQGGVSPSWFGVLFLVIFYFLLVNHIKTQKQLRIVIGALILASVVSLIIFGFNVMAKPLLPWNVAQTKSFNAIGSVANFSVFLGLVVVLALALFLDKPEKETALSSDSSRWQRENQGSGRRGRGKAFKAFIEKLSRLRPNKVISVLLVIFLFVSLLILQLVNFKVAWLVLMGAFFIFLVLVLSFYYSLNIRFSWIWLIILFFVLSLASYFLEIPPFYDAGLPAEISLSPKLSRTIALKTTFDSTKNFLFGNGPSTFHYAFSQFRPESFNRNLLWQWRFNRPAGYLWEVLTTSGWLGLISLIVFILFLLIAGFFILLRVSPRQSFWRGKAPENRQEKIITGAPKEPKEKVGLKSQMTLLVALLSCFAGLALAFLVITPSFSLVFMFWLLAGLVSVALVSASPKSTRQIGPSFQASPRYALIVSFISVLIFSFVAFLLIGGLRIYLAAYYARQSAEYFNEAALNQVRSPERSDKLVKAEEAIKKSLKLSKDQPQYLMLLARISFNQAVEEALRPAKQRNLKTVTNYLALAVNHSKKATDLLPYDAALWEARATLLNNAQAFTKQVREWVIKSYEAGAQLEPSNPLFVSQLGWLYYQDGRAQDNKPVDKMLLAKGQEYLEEAVHLKPDLLEARLGLMGALEELGNLAEAIRIGEEAIQSGLSSSARLLYEKGRLHYNQFVSQGDTNSPNDLNLAVSLFEQAVRLNPVYANALYSLSLAYEKQALYDFAERGTRIQQSISLLEKVLALNPDRKDVKQKLEDLKSQL